MDIEKLMAHISIIPDYRQAWKVEHKLSDILLLRQKKETNMTTKALGAIISIGIIASTYAKNIDYCKTIEFDTESFNYSAIAQASSEFK